MAFSTAPSYTPTKPPSPITPSPTADQTKAPSEGCLGKGKGKKNSSKKGKGKGRLYSTKNPATGKGKGLYSTKSPATGKGKGRLNSTKSPGGKGKGKGKGKKNCKKYSIIEPIEELGLPLQDVVIMSKVPNHGNLRGLR